MYTKINYSFISSNENVKTEIKITVPFKLLKKRNLQRTWLVCWKLLNTDEKEIKALNNWRDILSNSLEYSTL